MPIFLLFEDRLIVFVKNLVDVKHVVIPIFQEINHNDIKFRTAGQHMLLQGRTSRILFPKIRFRMKHPAREKREKPAPSKNRMKQMPKKKTGLQGPLHVRRYVQPSGMPVQKKRHKA